MNNPVYIGHLPAGLAVFFRKSGFVCQMVSIFFDLNPLPLVTASESYIYTVKHMCLFVTLPRQQWRPKQRASKHRSAKI